MRTLVKTWKYDFVYWLIVSVVFVLFFLLIGYKFTIFSLNSVFLSIPFYIMGLLIRSNSIVIQFDNKLFYMILLICIAFYMWNVALNNGTVDITSGIFGHSLIMFYINGLLGSYMVLLICGWFNKPIKIVQYVGANTIIVLGVHLITLRIAKFFMIYLSDIFINNDVMLHSFIISLFSFVFCYPFIILINRFAPWMLGRWEAGKISGLIMKSY